MARGSQRHASAWTASLAVHAAVLGALVWVATHRPPPPTPDDQALVYLEPPPPPPPPLSGGGATAAAPPSEPQGPPAPEPTPKLAEPVQPRPRPKPTPRPEPPRPPKPERTPRRQEPAPGPLGPAGGVAGGEAGGVAGGTVGGTSGGVIGGHGDAPVPAGRLAAPLEVVTRVTPVYPALAKARGIEGVVVLGAVVDRVGHVEDDIRVIRSVPLLDDAAVSALRQWHFKPGRNAAGELVRVQIELPLRFQLR